MHDAAPTSDDTPAGASANARRRPLMYLGASLMAAAVLIGAAWLIVGPAPKPADAGFPKDPPPLALPSETPDDSPLVAAATALAAGELDDARRRFTDIVAEDQDGVPGQVGLVLSRWRSTGPVSVERDLRQLVREYPESAFAALHLGLVQTLLEDPRAARETLREAVRLGHDAADPTSLRMARLANDLLHPDALKGDLPVLVAPEDVPASERRNVEALLEAVQMGDANEARRLAQQLADASDLTRVAVVSATFDKDDPEATVERLDAISVDPGVAPAIRDRARLMSILADLWGGGDRDDACADLAGSVRPSVDPGTRRLAVPIRAELCADAD